MTFGKYETLGFSERPFTNADETAAWIIESGAINRWFGYEITMQEYEDGSVSYGLLVDGDDEEIYCKTKGDVKKYIARLRDSFAEEMTSV